MSWTHTHTHTHKQSDTHTHTHTHILCFSLHVACTASTLDPGPLSRVPPYLSFQGEGWVEGGGGERGECANALKHARDF